ncbi:TetR/AcrR family transcriptional regulator C-terminal domain-containing protein [Rhizobium sp. 18055]|uniref:TetR/AcrR family transcriptional regulator C-terminal domain-containing protein n=1 Tax=Rhizobium sp. 18055 TaxID=2681403 RepID=UPI00135AD2E8|nr:TetR/AcrR family transcriptional regulator C-terminal domain-containing protein [Rhizobium sp. 18055]
MKIAKVDIVRAALDVLNEVGLDKLSTRMVAEKLGVQQPAIYWHMTDKRALIDAMNAEIMRSSHLYRDAQADEDWKSYLMRHSLSFRQALLSFRDGARVHAGSRSEASDADTGERQLRFLTEQGFEPGFALRMLVTLSRFTVGSVLEEQAEAAYPPSTQSGQEKDRPLLQMAFADYTASSTDTFFTFGVNVIIDGFSAAKK